VWTAAFVQPFTPDGPALTTAAVQEALTHGALSDPRQGAFVTLARDERAFFHWSLEFPDAAAAGRFDVILGNPPFMGGLRISGVAGEAYRRWLEAALAPFGGTADLCAAFFRRAFALLRPGGRLGMIATNTIGQGDTCESGLKVIMAQGGRIAFARRFVRWPGQASVEVNLVVIEAPRATPPHPPARGGDWGGPPHAGGTGGVGETAARCSTTARLRRSRRGSTPNRTANRRACARTTARRFREILYAASASCWRRRRRRRCWRATHATPTASSPT
jgi:hypothetical protein